mgnify:CR=1 FL=1
MDADVIATYDEDNENWSLAPMSTMAFEYFWVWHHSKSGNFADAWSVPSLEKWISEFKVDQTRLEIRAN